HRYRQHPTGSPPKLAFKLISVCQSATPTRSHRLPVAISMSSPIVENAQDETSPAFPLEITDHIIDCLRGSPGALCNCALTCHAWLPRSRYNLFHTMSICSLAALETLVSISRMPHILPHFDAVYRLSIYETPSHLIPRTARRQTKTARVGLFTHLLPLLLPQAFRTTRVLEITNTDWCRFPPHPSTRFHRSIFGSVTELGLTCCKFGSCNEFVRLISSFPSLLHLRLNLVRWENERLPGTAYCASPPALESLSLIMHKEIGAVMEWMLLHQNSCPLRHLTLI
ncbi:hypothetical protein B0H21DRAFT_845292, partial [Amylocystis lapponica]